ncbi:MAG TPA: hypothetical protein VN493_17105 [Thermoanaerobaculia bacterium]|nr:hypothetical protein [Thermoanaerobaculia bacterium]
MRRPSGEAQLLAALIAVHLIPIWTLSYFPSQDGPAHLAIANTLREYGGPDGQVLRDYFVREPGSVTNWFVYFLLAYGLGFLPVALAEKVFLSAYVILLPLSVRYAVGAVEPRNTFLALLAVPFTFNYLLGMGFYNFCFSLVAFFFALGYWLRYGLKHRERFGWLQGTVFALLALWVYVCHIVSAGMLVAAVVTLSAWEARAGGRSVLLRRLGPLLPTLALMLSFASREASRTTSAPVGTKLLQLLTLESLASFDSRTRFFGWAIAILFCALAAWALPRRSPRGDRWLAVVAVFFALALAVPSNVGVGGFIHQRLSLFPFLALILWLATFDLPAPLRRGIPILAVGLALGLLGLLWTRWREIDVYLAEYLSAEERIPRGSTLLHLSYAHCGRAPDGAPLAFRVQPFLHAGSRVATEKSVADLRLYAANYEGYFPLHYRPERNPYDHVSLGSWHDRVPPWVDLLSHPVDYVLLWQVSWNRRHPAVRSVRSQLETRYERIYVSPRGRAELWRRERTSGTRAVPTTR